MLVSFLDAINWRVKNEKKMTESRNEHTLYDFNDKRTIIVKRAHLSIYCNLRKL